MRARLTPNIDAAIQREDLPRAIEAAERAGLVHECREGVLVDADQPTARSDVRLMFLQDGDSGR